MSEPLSFSEQIEALRKLVPDWAVKESTQVKGPFTSGDYVTSRLNHIFTPAGWSVTILSGPEIVTINESNAYAKLVGRLIVRFANDTEAHQDDVGIWPLRATGAKQGGTLRDETAPERYETAEKAARTDFLKNAARNLGFCFAPLGDMELQEAIRRQRHRESEQAQAEEKKSAEEHIEELFGAASPVGSNHRAESSEPETAEPADEPPPGPPATAQGEPEAAIEGADYHLWPPPPEAVIRGYKAKLQQDAAKARERGVTGEPSGPQRGLMNGMVKKVVGDAHRKLVLAWIYDYQMRGFSTSQMDAAEVKVILDELKPEKIDGRNYEPTKGCQTFKWLARQAQLDAGQQTMEI